MKISKNKLSKLASRTVSVVPPTPPKGGKVKGAAPVPSKGGKARVVVPAPAPVKTGPERRALYVAVGLRGTVLCLGMVSTAGFRPLRDHNGETAEFTARPVPEGLFPACWKGNGAESLWGKACGLYVSPAGEPVRFLPLTQAESKGLVRWDALVVNDKLQKVLVPGGWKAVQMIPKYLGSDNTGGRWESFTHPQAALGRQAGFAAKVSIPGAKTPPAPAKGKAAPVKAKAKATVKAGK